MSEIITGEFNERETLTPLDSVALSIAKIQGGWDQKSKDLLKHGEFVPPMYEEEASPAEKILTGLITKAVSSFMGDTSMAYMVLGHPTTLDSGDLGLVALQTLVDKRTMDESGDWKMTALLSADIKKGNNFEKIFSRLKKNMERLSGTFSTAYKMAKKLFPKESFDDQELEDPENSVNKQLETIKDLYGGSDESLLRKKDELAQKMKTGLEERISTMKTPDLMPIKDALKIQTGDITLDSALGSATIMFTEILTLREESIRKLLEN